MIPESGETIEKHHSECDCLISMLESMTAMVKNYRYSGQKKDLKGLSSVVHNFVGWVFSSWI